jgi:hypothetical protein
VKDWFFAGQSLHLGMVKSESSTSPKGPFHCVESIIKKISPVLPEEGGRFFPSLSAQAIRIRKDEMKRRILYFM